MNIDNINKVIAHLQALQQVGNTKPFNMGDWFRTTNDFGNTATVRPPRDQADAARLLAVMKGSEAVPAEDRFKCNTVACIAGHTVLVATADGHESAGDIEGRAQRWLELDDKQTYDLFTPRLSDEDEQIFDEITVGQAIKAMEGLRDRGYVDWPFTFKPKDRNHPQWPETAEYWSYV